MVEWQYKTFWRRFGALLIDGLVLVPISVAGALVRAVSGGQAGEVVDWVEGGLFIAYPIFFHGLQGQTVGKMVTNIKVVRANDFGRISYWQAARRDLVPIMIEGVLAAFTATAFLMGDGKARDMATFALIAGSILHGAWFCAELITMLTNPRRRALHDFIAGTVVVQTTYLQGSPPPWRPYAERAAEPVGPPPAQWLGGGGSR